MLMKDMTEPQLSEQLGKQLRFIKSCQTPDTIGSMLIIFGDNGISVHRGIVEARQRQRCHHVFGKYQPQRAVESDGERRSGTDEVGDDVLMLFDGPHQTG